jgi:hypothetical protein
MALFEHLKTRAYRQIFLYCRKGLIEDALLVCPTNYELAIIFSPR